MKRNDLRLMLFNLMHQSVFKEHTVQRLQNELSEKEKAALLSLLNVNPIDMLDQEKLQDFGYLQGLAKAYDVFMVRLNNQSVLLAKWIGELENIAKYLSIRMENEDETSSVSGDILRFVRELRIFFDTPSVHFETAERKMLESIKDNKEADLNALVASLLCAFSFNEENLPLVEDFLQEKGTLIREYFKIFSWKRLCLGTMWC